MRRVLHLIDRKLEQFGLPIRLASGVMIALALFMIFSILFIDLALEVREQETLLIDRQILLWINQHSMPFLDKAMPVLTNIGGFMGVVAATAVVSGLAVVRRNYRAVIHIATSVAGAAAINLVLKALFQRQRPDLWVQFVTETSFSFPSGHAMASTALALSALVLVWRRGIRVRWWATLIAVGYILFVGFSRLYLGVHYPSDVLAGWMVSGAWVALVTVVLYSRAGKKAVK